MLGAAVIEECDGARPLLVISQHSLSIILLRLNLTRLFPSCCLPCLPCRWLTSSEAEAEEGIRLQLYSDIAARVGGRGHGLGCVR